MEGTTQTCKQETVPVPKALQSKALKSRPHTHVDQGEKKCCFRVTQSAVYKSF